MRSPENTSGSSKIASLGVCGIWSSMITGAEDCPRGGGSGEKLSEGKSSGCKYGVAGPSWVGWWIGLAAGSVNGFILLAWTVVETARLELQRRKRKVTGESCSTIL